MHVTFIVHTNEIVCEHMDEVGSVYAAAPPAISQQPGLLESCVDIIVNIHIKLRYFRGPIQTTAIVTGRVHK